MGLTYLVTMHAMDFTLCGLRHNLSDAWLSLGL